MYTAAVVFVAADPPPNPPALAVASRTRPEALSVMCRKWTPPAENAGGAAARAGFAAEEIEEIAAGDEGKARARLRKISAAFCFFF